MDTAVRPLVEELRRRGIDYRGVLYAGLMLTPDGPKVIEYNVRFGDPETQVVLPLLAGDAAELFLAVANGDLGGAAPRPSRGEAAVCVVLASQGYPEHPRLGDTIEGLDGAGQSVAAVDGVTVFHAGTRRHSPDGPFHTAGGRVLGVTAVAPTLEQARERAYAATAPIEWEGMQMRHDIAARLPAHRSGPGRGRVIPRYAPADMAALFSDTARFSLWLEVELLATEAQAALGVVPAEDAATCRAKAPTVDDVFVADVLEREKVTDHDVAAFVDVVQERIGAPAGSHIHYGLTSSDVVDTALCATLTRAADLLLADLDAFVAALKARALELMRRPRHRPHPRHARRAHDVRGQVRAVGAAGRPRPAPPARRPATAIAVGKLSGAVGTYSNIDPEVEAQVCAALGLTPVPATQVISRDRHAEYFYACAVHRGDGRAHVHRDPAPGPQRAGRGGGALRRRAEGQLVHAAQAQPDPLGAPVRAGPPAARLSRRRARGRGPVARARHLAQLGRAGGAARRVPAGLLHAAQGDRPGGRPGGPPRACAART